MADYDVATYLHPDRDAAWAFVRACDSAGIAAGFPSLSPGQVAKTVEVGVRSWQERELVDGLSNGAPVVAYRFANGETREYTEQ
jgi:hypothetical protein